MALPVVYRQSARREVVATARRYERERVGLAAVFIAEVERIEAFISDTPSLHQEVESGVRRASLRRFPFGLFYLEETNRILILACVDLRRDPQAISQLIGRR